MRPAPGHSSGANPLRWIDPVARDAVSLGYAHLTSDAEALLPLVRCHAMLWSRVLNQQDDVGAFWRELSRLARLAGISEAVVEQVNRQVMAELFDTIAQRYSRSPREAGSLSFEVARASCRIAVARPGAQESPDLALAKRRA